MAVFFVGYGIYYYKFRESVAYVPVEEDNARPFLPPAAHSAYATLVSSGHVDPMVAYARSLRDQHLWTELSTVLNEIDHALVRQSIDNAIARSPQESLLYLLRGQQSIAWAWEARGHGSSSDVSPQNAQLFAQRMQMAEADLYQAANLNPLDPTPLARIIGIVNHYKPDGEEEPAALAALQEAIRRNPNDYAARETYFNFFCRTRWGGSSEKLLDFANQAIVGAAHGDLRNSFIAEAHFDNWSHQLFFGSEEGANRVLQSGHAQAEVAESFAQSVGSPHHILGVSSISTLNRFAMWFFAIGDQQRCAQAFQRLQPNQCRPSTWGAIVDGTTTMAPTQYMIAMSWALHGGKYKRLG